MNGITRLMAAKGTLPTKLDTNSPSTTPYIEVNTIITIGGRLNRHIFLYVKWSDNWILIVSPFRRRSRRMDTPLPHTHVAKSRMCLSSASVYWRNSPIKASCSASVKSSRDFRSAAITLSTVRSASSAPLSVRRIGLLRRSSVRSRSIYPSASRFLRAELTVCFG